MKKALWILLAACLAQFGRAETVDLPKRAAELKNLRWGMFICWSFSTFSGKEWTPGVTNLSFFRATGVDTDQWARTAKEAHMGYILFLTKHHDGFCLWNTKTTERKVTRAPLGRDVLAELRKSCDKYGIRLALYFSEGEFDDNKNYHPGGYTPEMKKAQLKELLTEYGPIEYIWFDHAQTDGGLSHADTTAWCKQFQPGCFIGYNHGAPSGDIRLGEMGRPTPLSDPSGAGFGTDAARNYSGYLAAEFTYPILPPHEGGAMWFYSLPKHDALCLPAEKLYQDYLDAVKCGNLFSVDVGPNYEGKLREIDVQTLRKVGQWIDKGPGSHPPLLIASFSHNAAYILSTDDQVLWESPKMNGNCQDAWLLPNHHILLSGGTQVREVAADKSVVWQYDAPTNVPVEIHSCQPLPGGGALFGEGGTCRLIELDSQGKVTRELKLGLGGNAHTHMRQVRKTPRGTYLVTAAGENNIHEFDSQGSEVRAIRGKDIEQQGVKWPIVHSAELLENGNILIGGAYNAPVIEVDPNGKIVWKLSAEDIPDVGFNYSAGCLRLANGNTVVAAYTSKYPVFEVTPGKKVLWKLQNPAIGNPTHVKILTPEAVEAFLKSAVK